MKEKLPIYVRQQMGDDFFVDFRVTLQKPIIPADLQAANEAKQVAIQQNLAQEERNATINTEIDSIQDLVDVLGIEGYLIYKAINDGDVQIIPIPQGTDVVVGAK